jgi:hypothetical protein
MSLRQVKPKKQLILLKRIQTILRPFVLISSECTVDCHYFYMVFLKHFCLKTCMFPVPNHFLCYNIMIF